MKSNKLLAKSKKIRHHSISLILSDFSTPYTPLLIKLLRYLPFIKQDPMDLCCKQVLDVVPSVIDHNKMLCYDLEKNCQPLATSFLHDNQSGFLCFPVEVI